MQLSMLVISITGIKTSMSNIWHTLRVSIKTLIIYTLGLKSFCTKLFPKISNKTNGRRGRDRMVVRFRITYDICQYHHYNCEFESRYGEVYSIQHYVMFVSDLRHVSGFLRFPPPIKYQHDITEILLKVALNSITTPIKP
jgi:hypothetical protein